MNFLKKILGSNKKDDLVFIPSGQLILSRSPASPKSESECLYNDAVASIRQTSEQFNYTLVIQRAYEEGEEQLKDSDESDDSLLELEAGDERTFLIDEELNFHKYINADGNTTIVWKDVSGDDGDKFAFVCDTSIPEDLVESFMNVVKKCEYERKYKRASLGVSEADLEEFQYDPSKEDINKDILKNADFLASSDDAPSTEEEDEEEEDEDEDDDGEFKDAVSGSPTKSSKPASAGSKKPSTTVYDGVSFKKSASFNEAPSGDELVIQDAELHFFDPEETAFVLKNKEVSAKVLDAGKWKYWLVVEDKNSKKVLLASQIGQDMSPTFNYDHLCFIFNYVVSTEDATSWLLKFDEFNTLNEFQSGFMQALWETLNKVKWGKTTEKDHDYVLDAFNNLQLEDYDEDIKELEKLDDDDLSDEESSETNDEELPKAILSGKQTIKYDNDEDYDDEELAALKHFKSDNEKNKSLAISYNNDRSYVARGNKIGVFKATDGDDEDESLKLYTSINGVKTSKGKEFNPEKMMLHGQDTSLILQDPNSLNNLYRMDLNKGKVVEEYNVGTSDAPVDVLQFNPTQKFSQLTDEKNFLGLSTNGLFKVDPRLSGNNLVESEYKKYLTKTNFTAITTTALGHIAVASKDGEIKLYDRLGINAKTRLPGLGEQVKGLDASADGRWVLATCKTYLLLIEVQIKEGKNAGTTGFLRSFPKDAKPAPRMLKLSTQHVAMMRNESKKPLDFTVAHFNTGISSKETTIITSSGNYVIQWSMRKVLKGEPEPYRIKRYGLEVTADNFKFGSDKSAIVAMSDDVALANKKSFKRASSRFSQRRS